MTAGEKVQLDIKNQTAERVVDHNLQNRKVRQGCNSSDFITSRSFLSEKQRKSHHFNNKLTKPGSYQQLPK